jgi:hypothetical protein
MYIYMYCRGLNKKHTASSQWEETQCIQNQARMSFEEAVVKGHRLEILHRKILPSSLRNDALYTRLAMCVLRRSISTCPLAQNRSVVDQSDL